MCGLVGLFAHDGHAPHRAVGLELVDHLRHRGPDAGAYWADGPFFLGTGAWRSSVSPPATSRWRRRTAAWS